MGQLLKYTDYKVAQALWLQIQNSERKDYGTRTIEQFCVEKYLDYLLVCGYKNREVIDSIKEVKHKINPQNIYFSRNEQYDENVDKNVHTIMDDLTNNIKI